jgi:uncharacterized protein
MPDHFTSRSHRPLHVRQREHLDQHGWHTIDRGLQRPCSYRHPAGRIRRIETHISVIYLAGRYAYKLKKPVNLDFVDFTRPAARQRACRDEVRLNRRLAGELYCGVETIVRKGRVCKIGKRGRAVEHAVKMRRFREHDVFSALLARGELGFAEIDALDIRHSGNCGLRRRCRSIISTPYSSRKIQCPDQHPASLAQATASDRTGHRSCAA